MKQDELGYLIILTDGQYEFEVTKVELDPEKLSEYSTVSEKNWNKLLNIDEVYYAITQAKKLDEYRVSKIESYRFDTTLTNLSINHISGEADGYFKVDQLGLWLSLSKRETPDLYNKEVGEIMNLKRNTLCLVGTKSKVEVIEHLTEWLLARGAKVLKIIFDNHDELTTPSFESVLNALSQASYVIVEISEESTDIGFVIGQAMLMKLKVIALLEKGSLVEPIIRGINDPGFFLFEYTEIQDAIKLVEKGLG